MSMSNKTNIVSMSSQAKALLLDIEGTTTPITFVTEILFPYVADNFVSYLQSKWNSEEVTCVIRELQLQAKADIADGMKDVPPIEISVDNDIVKVLPFVEKNVRWQMSINRKTTALKKLQGYVLEDAYESGAVKGALYDDVWPVLTQLKSEGKKIYIYSSGSIKAQKLLFGYTEKGNMMPLLDGYFDTTTGDKKNCDSYHKIASDIELQTSEMLFLTDVEYEADAAVNAGMNALVVVRPGNKPLNSPDKYPLIESFYSLVSE